jgi:hypothetical protein
VGTPETIARRAVARKPMVGNRVRLVVTLVLVRERAERLTARALREGKNLGRSWQRSSRLRIGVTDKNGRTTGGPTQ